MSDAMEDIRKEFHNINNWLHKITTKAGLARFELETKGLNEGNIDEEEKKYIKIFCELEEYAMKVGEIIKNIRKSMDKNLPNQ